MNKNMKKNVKLQIGNGSVPIFNMEYGCNFYFESFLFFESWTWMQQSCLSFEIWEIGFKEVAYKHLMKIRKVQLLLRKLNFQEGLKFRLNQTKSASVFEFLGQQKDLNK